MSAWIKESRLWLAATIKQSCSVPEIPANSSMERRNLPGGAEKADQSPIQVEISPFLYGVVVGVNLVRDKGTGKSKGFAFVAYEDQRSAILAVDNLNGAQILGRIVRVDHCSKYRKKEEEDEETERQKREARGCAALSREANAPVELDTNSPRMSKELPTQVGVLRIKVQDGATTCLRVRKRVRKDQIIKKALGWLIKIRVPEQRAVRRPWRATLKKLAVEKKRDRKGMMMMKLQEMIVIRGKKKQIKTVW